MFILKADQFLSHIRPGVVWSWEEMEANTPRNSIALDGMVCGGPRFDPKQHRVNFDHHDNVVREATMSTAAQVYLAIKGGLMTMFRDETVHVYINDIDQDVSMAVWLLLHHMLFKAGASFPVVSRILSLNDRLDITGGSFPMNMSNKLIRQHMWLFDPYADLRKSGGLARADASTYASTLEACLARLDRMLTGDVGEVEALDIRVNILEEHRENGYRFVVYEELGGSTARWNLFSEGMDAFIAIIATRPSGRLVTSIGRRSRYIPHPILGMYQAYNDLDGFDAQRGWGGSDIVGGSHRGEGTAIPITELTRVALELARAY